MAPEKPSDRLFVSELAEALGRSRKNASGFEEAFPLEAKRLTALQEIVAHRSHASQINLFNQLVEQAGTIQVDVIGLAALEDLVHAVVDLAAPLPRPATVVSWDHPFLTGIGLGNALADIDAAFVIPENLKHDDKGIRRQKWRQAASRAALGLTGADYCIAETATLVMRNRAAQPRSASLLPDIHAAVITLDQIIASPAELFALMGGAASVKASSVTNCMTWVSSNSKTGDIEAELVPGVHGPKKVVIYVITGPDASGKASGRK